MGKALKYASLGLTGGIMAMILVISFIEGDKLRKCITCKKIEVNILDSLENNFVSTSDVRRFIDRSYGEYIGFRADSIDLVKIEDIVNSRSAVLRSDAYMTKDGTLHIDVTQRKPVVRFQKEDGGFYADADGYIFPLQSRFASHVQIIDGNIPLAANSGYKGSISSPREKEWFERIMGMVNYIEDKEEWKDKIVQIHVRGDGSLILIPRQGDERFIFGQPDRVEEKFHLIKRYYTAIVPEKGSGKYRTVDVRYKDRIICR